MIAAMRGLALGAGSLLLAVAAAAAEPVRVALVQPAHPDPIAAEAATRIRAELLAAGFAVVLIEADPAADAAVEPGGAAASRVRATVVVVRTDHGAAADVWIADRASHGTLVRRVDAGAGEPSSPADLAIRAVELLRAGLFEPRAAPSAAPPAEPPPDLPGTGPAEPPEAPPAPRPTRPRALLERFTAELGLTAIYGLGGASGRLAPTLRFAYGAGTGLAGRLTVMGPTSTDQAAVLEVAYGFDRSWRVLAPVVALGAGACHTHLDDTVTAKLPALSTEAWAGAFSASAGVAARATDRAAFLVDAHAFLVEPGPGAIVGMAPAAGKPQLLVTASLGVVAGF
jgi:hypothetical protein